MRRFALFLLVAGGMSLSQPVLAGTVNTGGQSTATKEAGGSLLSKLTRGGRHQCGDGR